MAKSATEKTEAKLQLENEVFTRQKNYILTFNQDSPSVEFVLKDLAKFCRAHESTFHEDPRKHALLEGRREVFLRIAEFLNLSSKDIYELWTGTKF